MDGESRPFNWEYAPTLPVALSRPRPAQLRHPAGRSSSIAMATTSTQPDPAALSPAAPTRADGPLDDLDLLRRKLLELIVRNESVRSASVRNEPVRKQIAPDCNS